VVNDRSHIRTQNGCPAKLFPTENKWLSREFYVGQHVNVMDFDMQSRSLRIDRVHTRAITREVAERLRLILPQDQPEPGSSLQRLISRLPELDDDFPPTAPE
jgi:hypothetical protein